MRPCVVEVVLIVLVVENIFADSPTASVSVSLCPCDTDEARSALLSLYYATGGPTSWMPSSLRFDETMTVCAWPHVECHGGDDAPAVGSDDPWILDVTFHSGLGMQGTLPDGFAGLGKHLRSLTIYDQPGIYGPIPPLWAMLVGLRRITLGNLGINGSLPSWIGESWSGLEQFSLYSTNVGGALPSSIGNMKALTILHLSANNFSGTLPEAMGAMTSLTHVALQWNALLGGTIPEALGNLTNLRILNINECGFEGSLPESIQRLTNLFFLRLRLNKLTGTLPAWLPMLQSLRQLIVDGNRMTGTLPSRLGLPPIIRTLRLDNNSFYGPLPPSWPSHPTLSYVTLDQLDSSTNRVFCGGIPLSWRANNSNLTYVINASLVDQPCPSFTESVSLSSCTVPMRLVVALAGGAPERHANATIGGFLSLPLIGTVPLIAAGDDSSDSVVLYLTFEVPYDVMAFHASSVLTFGLNTSSMASAGGPLWPLERDSERYRVIPWSNGSAPGGADVLLFPTSGQWPITFAPYRSQVVPLAQLHARCAAEQVLVVVVVLVQPRATSQLATAVGTSSSVATWGSAFSPSGSTASATARVAAVQKLLLCSETAGDDGGGGLIGWSLPPKDNLGAARGAIAGNTLLILGFTGCALAVAKGLAAVARTSWWTLVQRMHVPTLMFPLFAATLPSSVGGAVLILKAPTGSVDTFAWLLLVVCMVCWGAPLLWLAWTAATLPRLICPVIDMAPAASKTATKQHCARSLIERATRRHTFWRPAPGNHLGRAAAASALSTHHVILREYSWLWFPCVECVVTALGGAIAAATIGVDAAVCQGGSIALCVLFAGQLVLTAWMRPFTTIAGFVHSILLSVLSTLCVAFQVGFSAYRGADGTDDNDALWAMNGSTASALAVLGIAAMRTAFDCVALWQGVRGLERYVRSARASPQGSHDLLHSDSAMGQELMTFEAQSDAPLQFVGSSEDGSSSLHNSSGILHGSIRLSDSGASSFRMSDVEAQFWDAHGNARVNEGPAIRAAMPNHSDRDLLSKKF